MTRIHDGSPPPILQPETSIERSAASGGTEGPLRSIPSGSATPPVRGVFVSYDEFKKRRQLRLRVEAAFEKLQSPQRDRDETTHAHAPDDRP
jgi:hypothetical protein